MAEQTLEDTDGCCNVCFLDGNKIKAHYVCVECLDFLCNDCLDIHSNNKILGSHRILKMEELNVSVTPDILLKVQKIVRCEEHGKEPKYVCQEHSELVCLDCIKSHHRKCAVTVPNDTLLECTLQDVSELTNTAEDLKQRAEKSLQGHVEDKEVVGKLYCLIPDDLQNYMKSLIENVIERIEEDNSCLNSINVFSNNLLHCQQLLQAVLQLNDTEKAKIVASYVQLSIAQEADRLPSDTECTTKTLVLVGKIKVLLHDIMRSILKLPCTQGQDKGNLLKACKETQIYNRTGLAPPPGDLDAARCLTDAVPGKIIDSSFPSMKDTATQTSNEDYKETVLSLSERNLEFLGIYKIRTFDDFGQVRGKDLSHVTAVVVMENSQIIISDSKFGGLVVFDAWFQPVSHRKTDSTPLAMCGIQGVCDQIAVLFSHCRIQIYRLTSEVLTRLRGFDIGRKCRSICSASNCEVALLFSDEIASAYYFESERNNSDIYVQIRSTLDGTIQKTICNFSPDLGSVYTLHSLQGRTVAGEENRLTAFDNDGTCDWVYQGNQSNLAGVQSQTTDPDGNIYICGRDSSNVHQVSISDATCNRVIVPQLHSPTCIAYDPHHERLIICCEGSKWLYVYNFV